MDYMKDGWFTETGVLNKDSVALSIKIDQVIYSEKSKYQDIMVLKSKIFGTCLVLDNCIQCTEKDEASYQEMIAFLPLNSHASPKRVLVIGGGDGGVVREVVKHPLVEEVVMCEIDEAVIRISKDYLPFMASAFDSPKLKINIEDGFEFVKKNQNSFDVIITDSSDPIGPAEVLFQKPYFEALHGCLRKNGIICSQAESIWFDLPLIKSLVSICKTIFTTVGYAVTSVPSYPSGQIGFLICSKEECDFSLPVHKFSAKQKEAMNLKVYSEEMHASAFCLPVFVKDELSNC